jgi:hypothetical protein
MPIDAESEPYGTGSGLDRTAAKPVVPAAGKGADDLATDDDASEPFAKAAASPKLDRSGDDDDLARAGTGAGPAAGERIDLDGVEKVAGGDDVDLDAAGTGTGTKVLPGDGDVALKDAPAVDDEPALDPDLGSGPASAVDGELLGSGADGPFEKVGTELGDDDDLDDLDDPDDPGGFDKSGFLDLG